MTPAVIAVVLALVLIIGGFIIANQRGQLAAGPRSRGDGPKPPPPVQAPATLLASDGAGVPGVPGLPGLPGTAGTPGRGSEGTPPALDLLNPVIPAAGRLPADAHAAHPPVPTARAAGTPAAPVGDDLGSLPSIAIQMAASTARLSIPAGSAREVEGLRRRLAAPRGGFMARLAALFRGKADIDPSVWERMEDVLLSSDVGIATTNRLIQSTRLAVEAERVTDAASVWRILKTEAHAILAIEPKRALVEDGKTNCFLLVGVNGAGKTTTIGKLATRWKTDGRTVILGAADTFRAAAVAQLEAWGRRIGVTVVKGKDGADPASVAFEATKKGVDDGAQVVLVDTAGRLQTKQPLMDELRKIHKSMGKALEGAPHETLLVLDATTGQNALQQALLFREAAPLTGIVLTKLDGTAKGGIILAICAELQLPVRFVGLGERADDLRTFHANDFVEALFGDDPSSAPEISA